MGNANQAGNRDQSQTIQAIKGWPLLFHQIHSTNIQLSSDQRRAKRLETFCNGICFSNRPVSVGEQVILRFAEVSTSWSGVLRFGFTSHDPTSINAATLPRYACPDLTNKYGYWAKALPERFAIQDNILCFHVCRSGNVMYAVNGEDKGVFFGSVTPGQPLWALIDVYGNTTSIEFIDPRLILSLPLKDTTSSPTLTSSSNFFISLDAQQLTSVRSRTQDRSFLPLTHQSLRHNPTQALEYQANNLNLHQYNHRQQQQHRSLPPGSRPSNHSCSLPDMTSMPVVAPPPIKHHKNLASLLFHTVVGKNVWLSSDKNIAARVLEEYCNGYAFTSRPIKPGEQIVIQILSLDGVFTGGIAFGMTSCDISQFKPTDFPDDADLLLDRPEYWVVNKDVCSNPVVGDELSFHFTDEGEIKYGKNGFHISTLMHVDKEVKLWAFFDIYGQTQKIKILGVATPSTSSLPSTGNPYREQLIQQQLSPLDGNFPKSFALPEFTHQGSVASPALIKSTTTTCPQVQIDGSTSSDVPPPRPPPPLKKTTILQPIPALPPKQTRASSGVSMVSDSFDGSVLPLPMSPSRITALFDALAISSVKNMGLSSQQHSHPPAPYDFEFNPSTTPTCPGQQPKGLTIQKPSTSLHSCATFRVPKRRPINMAPPAISAEFPGYTSPSSSTPTLSIEGRIAALVQSGGIPLATFGPPAPPPGSNFNNFSNPRSEPAVRRKPSVTNNAAATTSSTAAVGSTAALSIKASEITSKLLSAGSSSESKYNGECSVCLEHAPDCALYTCGHMCMCYDCATALKETKDAQCPICRQPIKDIIKIYRS